MWIHALAVLQLNHQAILEVLALPKRIVKRRALIFIVFAASIRALSFVLFPIVRDDVFYVPDLLSSFGTALGTGVLIWVTLSFWSFIGERYYKSRLDFIEAFALASHALILSFFLIIPKAAILVLLVYALYLAWILLKYGKSTPWLTGLIFALSTMVFLVSWYFLGLLGLILAY